MVDEVRAPVVELTAAETAQSLPVETALESMAAQFDHIDFAQFAGGDDFRNVLKR